MEKPYWEGKHYAFFSNKECEYFPCHKVDSGDELLQVNIGKLREEIWERMDKEMYCEHCIGQKGGCEFYENYTR